MIETLRLKSVSNFKTTLKRKTVRKKMINADVTKTNIELISLIKNKTYNFYIKMIVQFIKSDKKKYDIQKTFINEESSLNLISQRMIKKMKFNIIKDEFTIIKTTNDE